MADETSRKIERLELIQKYLSILIAIATFWTIALSWNYYGFGELQLVPRLGLAAALAGIAFLHAEAIGMLIMTMMKEKWQAEGRDAREAAQEAKEEARQAKAEAQEAQLQAREAQAQLREAQAQAEAREAQAREAQAEAQMQAREAQAEAQMQAREAQLQMREAQVEAREREAQAQETIRDLTRRLEALERGENSNGEKA